LPRWHRGQTLIHMPGPQPLAYGQNTRRLTVVVSHELRQRRIHHIAARGLPRTSVCRQQGPRWMRQYLGRHGADSRQGVEEDVDPNLLSDRGGETGTSHASLTRDTPGRRWRPAYWVLL